MELIDRLRKLGYSLSESIDIYLSYLNKYDDDGLLELECWIQDQEKEKVEYV